MEPRIDMTPEEVAATHAWIRDRAPTIRELINRVRSELAHVFETTVDPVSVGDIEREIDVVFDDGDRAVNVATLVVLLRSIHVEDDYPGFVIDELLGRELAGMIAGDQPFRLLAEATFHYADATHHTPEARAGRDDLDAALAAGFQTRLPGWPWTAEASPFAIENETP